MDLVSFSGTSYDKQCSGCPFGIKRHLSASLCFDKHRMAEAQRDADDSKYLFKMYVVYSHLTSLNTTHYLTQVGVFYFQCVPDQRSGLHWY
jgi:hypothetical protein